MERIHGVNLQPLKSVMSWDTKRVIAYKNRIQTHISYLETCNRYDYVSDDEANLAVVTLQKFKNYKKELKNILQKREHIG